MKIKKMLCLLLACIMMMSSVVFAKQKDREINFGEFENEEGVKQYLEESNVPKEKLDFLIEKLENGILWDCYNEEKLNEVPSDFNCFDISTSIKEKYFRFEDGSFIKISVGGGEEIENYYPEANVVQPLSDGTVSINSDSFGVLFVNHKVEKQVGLTIAYFYANFYVARYGASIIYTNENSNGDYNSPFGEGVAGFGVGANPSKEMIRDYENTSTSQAAMFRLYWFNTVTISGAWKGIGGTIPVGSTCNLYLALVNNHMYIDSNLPF